MIETSSTRAIISPLLTPLRDVHEQNVANAFCDNISNHNDPKDGFTLLRHQPDAPGYEFQRLDCIGLSGNNASAEDLRKLAGFVYPEFEQVVDRFAKRKDLLNHAASWLLSGNEMGFLTDHYKSVTGVAVAGGSFLCALYENTPVTPGDIDTNIIVSFFIKYTNLQGFKPTPIILGEIFSQTTFTTPPSPSTRFVIPTELRHEINTESVYYLKTGQIRERIDETQQDESPADSIRKKGRVVILAGSGGRDITVDTHFDRERHLYIPRTTHLGPLAFGTADIISSTPTLEVGLDMSGRRPKTFIRELPPRAPENSFSADSLMQSIAHGMSTPTHRRQYHPSRKSFDKATGKPTAAE